MKKFITIVLNLIVFLPQAFSCGVCFGQVDTPMTRALNWGIIFMLGVLILVFSGVFAFVWNVRSRQRRLNLLETKIC